MWLSEEDLKIAEERREVKSNAERERYIQLKAGFQRIARRGKKVFLNKQCKEVKGNNKMGKARNLFKKIGGIKGTFSSRMGMRNDRNRKDLTEAKENKKRWQEYTEELFKSFLNNLDNHDGVVIHIELDILEWSQWALRRITMNKASGGDRIPAELFQILKDDVVKVLHSTCQQIWKTQQWSQDWKGQFSLQSQRRAMQKNVQTVNQLCSFHMLVSLGWKSIKVVFSSTWTENF